LVSLLNAGFGLIEVAGTPLTLERMLGWVMAPVAFMMGVPWSEAPAVGGVLGTRTVINEIIAFLQLNAAAGTMSERSHAIATFAVCGFANFSSIGIQIGGLGALAPGRRGDIAKLGIRALVAATLANFMTAAVAGALI
jgi:CNT family concentrative nucleoside transporter